MLICIPGNAFWPDGSVMELKNVGMGVMNPKRHVGPTVRRSNGEGLPVTMANASGPHINVMEKMSVTMEAMKHISHIQSVSSPFYTINKTLQPA